MTKEELLKTIPKDYDCVAKIQDMGLGGLGSLIEHWDWFEDEVDKLSQEEIDGLEEMVVEE